jgi:hypothetical protein
MAKEQQKPQTAMVFIPKDPLNEYEEVVSVSLNGRTWNIARGSMVEVPLDVAVILKISKHITDYKVI